MSHSHSEAYDHSHSHSHLDQSTLTISLLLIGGFMLLEFIGGKLFHSLALTADAGHMANDTLSLALALFALRVAHHRFPIAKWLALINGSSLIVIALWIIWEALQRLQAPSAILSLPMLVVATLGLLVNVFVARMMLKANHDNLNIRAAYLHVLADLLGSVVAIVVGIVTYYLAWNWVDPVASLLLSVIILRSGWQVCRQAVAELKSV